MDFSTFLAQLYYLKIFPYFILYLIICTLAPYICKRYTKPLELKLVLLWYNIACLVLNLVAAIGMIRGMFLAEHLLSNTETPALMPFYRLYANLKIFELLDTVFMLLRHRFRQITFLHVFHHSSMLLLIHYGLQYSPWTALALALALNSIVHVVMHFYYAYTIYMPSSSRPTWKRRITELQIAQFLIDLVYCSIGIAQGKMCIWSFFYGLSMVSLFTNFYVRAYIYTPKPIGAQAKPSNGANIYSNVTNGAVKKNN